MAALIGPDQLPQWVPGQLTVQSPADWEGISTRGYRYAGSDVEVPPLSDHMIVAYRRGATTMRRRARGKWLEQRLEPGDVSLLTRASSAHWIWPTDIEVVHVYLPEEELNSAYRDMTGHEVHEVELHDSLSANDSIIYRTAMQVAHEAAQGGAGSRLMIESLRTQLAIHILRRHSTVHVRTGEKSPSLTTGQERTVRDYIEAHLDTNMSLEELANLVGMGRSTFTRRFKLSTRLAPYEFLLQQRIHRARTLLRRTNAPLHEIALQCGFADQSHLTREFKKRMGIPPGVYRKGAGADSHHL